MNQSVSVYAAFCAACEKYPDRPFLYVPQAVARAYAISSGEISYSQLQLEVRHLVERYQTAGYGSGHRVAFMLDNRPNFIAHWFALNALGASVVPINAELSVAEIVYLLDLSEASLLVVVAEHREIARSAAADASASIPLYDVDQIADVPRASRAPTARDIDTMSECAMLFTSGSTGQPKACVLSNEYFLEMGYWYRDLGGLCALEEGSERLATPLPLTHMNAMATSLMAMLVTGGCVVQLDRFHPRSWWETVHEAGATVIHYLGVMPAILLQLEESELERTHSIKFGFGAGVNPAHHEVFEERYGFPLIEAWAMTETGAGGCIVANREPRHVAMSCFGKPNPSRLEFRLVDEGGSDVQRGNDGELLVRAAGEDPRKGYFSGYYRNAPATEDGWREDWWHTGDVVRELDDGSLCFVDRRKNIIRRSGENIAALEVEAVLSRHPAMTALAVTPVPDELRGEEVMACIVLATDVAPSEQTAASIFELCLAALAYFKAPGYIVFVDALPLTATQKPKRNEIKDLARSYLETTQADVSVFDLRERKRKPKI